jgi:hypothetical protein
MDPGYIAAWKREKLGWGGPRLLKGTPNLDMVCHLFGGRGITRCTWKLILSNRFSYNELENRYVK